MILDYPNGIDILFEDVTPTEEEISKRFKELSLIYHTDKTTKWKKNSHKQRGKELFMKMNDHKN